MKVLRWLFEDAEVEVKGEVNVLFEMRLGFGAVVLLLL